MSNIFHIHLLLIFDGPTTIIKVIHFGDIHILRLQGGEGSKKPAYLNDFNSLKKLSRQVEGSKSVDVICESPLQVLMDHLKN